MVKSQPFLRYILRGIPAIAVAVLLSACSTSNTAKNMHPETRVVGMEDSSSLQASQDEFENMVRNLDVKSRIMDQYADWKGVRYRLGGSTKTGIDCSGFTQMVYKLNGYKLLLDASQQSMQGEALSFIEESEPGDLAFFDNEEGNIIHVGIIMEDNHIIHASGKVRIDRLDHLGIFNAETNKHTHKLRVIKKII